MQFSKSFRLSELGRWDKARARARGRQTAFGVTRIPEFMLVAFKLLPRKVTLSIWHVMWAIVALQVAPKPPPSTSGSR